MIGVSLACGEFGKVPGVFDRDYTYPGEKHFAYCKSKGLLVVRLPFKWERVQREAMAPLDESEMARLDRVVGHARKHGIRLLLDVHNYARCGGKLIGTKDLPNEAFADLWRKLATHYKDESAIFAYGLMNEPHDTEGLWPAAAQAAVDAIRSVDRTHTIFVCGDGWGGAHSWQAINRNLAVNDPEGNLVYEAHQYLDRDSSGTYKESYDASGATPTLGAERLKPFADWLKERNARGFIGEFGVPDNDPRWLVVLDNFLAAMKENGIGGTYWAAGPWWGKYAQSVEPRDGRDRPQMAVLERYAEGGDPALPKPWLAAAAEAERAARESKERAPAGPREGVAHDFAARGESYHYTNEGSEFASESVEDAGRKARKITYKHRGGIAWVGVGIYFGGLGCAGQSGFALGIRSEKPCRLEVKAYHADDERYTGVFDVGTEWQELAIPFDRLTRDGKPYDPGKSLRKIEFQPNPDPRGNSLCLGTFRRVPCQ
ncbi:MAG TPA: glycoside hydrolase family 5 protein [Planctomycetota bacterium]|nr:glycoside hydrolase family 5 protein [Planctomycetota bacterium]